MVDEEKLHHRLPDRQDFRTLGENRHPFHRLGIASDLKLGHLLDLDQTHAAVARDRKPRVIAIVRNSDAYIRGRLNDVVPLAVVTSLPSIVILIGSIIRKCYVEQIEDG